MRLNPWMAIVQATANNLLILCRAVSKGEEMNFVYYIVIPLMVAVGAGGVGLLVAWLLHKVSED